MRAGIKTIGQRATLLFLVTFGSFSTTQVYSLSPAIETMTEAGKKAFRALEANLLNNQIAGKFIRIESQKNNKYFRVVSAFRKYRLIADGYKYDPETTLKVVSSKSKTGIPVVGFQSEHAGCLYLESTAIKTKNHVQYEVRFESKRFLSWQQWLLSGPTLNDCKLKALLGSKTFLNNPGKKYRGGLNRQAFSPETAWTKGPSGDSQKLSIEIIDDIIPPGSVSLPGREMFTVAAGSSNRVLGADPVYFIPWYWNEGQKKWIKFTGLPEGYTVGQISVGNNPDDIWCIGHKTRDKKIDGKSVPEKYGDKAFRWDRDSLKWVGSRDFSRISVGNAKNVWAQKIEDRLLRRWNGKNWKTPPQPPGRSRGVSVGGDNTVWSFTSTGIYRLINNKWELIPATPPGLIKQISVANAFNVYGLNSENKIFKWNEKRSDWDSIPGMMYQISVNKQGDVVGGLWGITHCQTVLKPDPNPAPKTETKQDLISLMESIESDLETKKAIDSNDTQNRWLYSLYLLVENMEGKSSETINDLANRLKKVYAKVSTIIHSFNSFQRRYLEKQVRKKIKTTQ